MIRLAIVGHALMTTFFALSLTHPNTARAAGDVCDSPGICGIFGRCIQTEDDDEAYCIATPRSCADAPTCYGAGLCTYTKDGAPDGAPWCRATLEGCKQSGVCSSYGRCYLGDKDGVPVCTVRSDAECADSEACKDSGRCVFDPDATDAPACKVTAAGCATSVQCKRDGACGFSPGSGCVAVTDADCKASTDCAKYGQCALPPGADHCQVTTSEHCAISEVCRLYAQCDLDVARSQCVVTRASCARFPACAERGECAPGKNRDYATCEVETPADCADSRICKAFGACSATHHRGFDEVSCQPTDIGPHFCQDQYGKPTRIRRITASSTQPRGKRHTYDVRNLTDDDSRTSWQPKTSTEGGVGAKLTIKLAKKTWVGQLHIANGFQDTDAEGDLYFANNRIRYAFVTVGNTPKQLMHFTRDEPDTHTMFVASVFTDTITLEVVEVVKGTRWNDLAISEIAVIGCDDCAEAPSSCE